MFKKVTKEDIVKQGKLGWLGGPLSVSRWVVFRNLTWKERIKALIFGRICVTESYSMDKPEVRSYEISL